MLSFILDIIILLIFASFSKQNPKNQTTVDEHRHNFFVILVFFIATSQGEKIYKLPPPFTNKHKSSTSGEEN
jgi:hypothetical protein